MANISNCKYNNLRFEMQKTFHLACAVRLNDKNIFKRTILKKGIY